jgi:hypothetical protein
LFSKILNPQEVLEILANPEDEILAMGVDGDLEIAANDVDVDNDDEEAIADYD